MTSPDDRDVLSRATSALRDEAAADPPAAGDSWRAMDGWRHVSRDVRKAARRRRLGLLLALQLLATVVGVGAWAAVSGRLPPLFSRWVAPARQTAPVPAARAHVARAHRESPAVVTALLPEATPATAPPAPAAIDRPSHLPPRAPLPVVAPINPAAPGAPLPEEIYARAHRAQFVSRDYAAALALWDQYLATTGGSLALEARWNRAIALVRLGRRDAAIAALRLFAAGENDGYRQEEAQALLRVLGTASP